MRARAGHSRPSADRFGVTLVEVLVVLILAGVVIGGASLLMSRTGRTVQKGGEMLNMQLLLKSIVERLRSDIRTLVEIETCSDGHLEFTAVQGGKPARIAYRYDDVAKTLTRTDSLKPGAATQFHGAKNVAGIHFRAMPSNVDVQVVQVTLELLSEEKKGLPPTKLSLVCQFATLCRPALVSREF
jgi:prepilin-type N-terminal cleavage/methylation domain-containing protein